MLRAIIRVLPLAGVLAGGLLVTGMDADAAVYRSVAPDGTVTYSDQPQAARGDAPANGNNDAQRTPQAALPYALRQAAARYPVTLYTASACEPCVKAQSFLRARGIPFTERTINTPADVTALEQLAGTKSVPVVTIGAQHLSGFSEPVWTQYLDAAGYPAESQLPANWSAPAPMPLASAADATPDTPPHNAPVERDPVPAPGGEFTPTPGHSNPANIRF